MARRNESSVLKTDILSFNIDNLQSKPLDDELSSVMQDWELKPHAASSDAHNLRRAANELQDSDIPVAFPTETVYGLGADATRSSAVQGIYKAKQRPSDNPLIVHFHSLNQLRNILNPDLAPSAALSAPDPIPAIYRPLIQRFWPGPLTMLMPSAKQSALAPEVTAGLHTFGARMPSNKLALALIKLADRPLAAPSANASSKPSPTTAAHVKHDLDGRIRTILDGGSCDVGVESTVVDGLTCPPSILRPGGISLDDLRSCQGWENVTIAYKDASQSESRPRAPGMKYKHYSPRAKVVLFEHGTMQPSEEDVLQYVGANNMIGIIRTSQWRFMLPKCTIAQENHTKSVNGSFGSLSGKTDIKDERMDSFTTNHCRIVTTQASNQLFKLWDISIGPNMETIAQGLFAALRDLDLKNVDAILVEGIDDNRGDLAAAIMNRIRKAAEVEIGKI